MAKKRHPKHEAVRRLTHANAHLMQGVARASVEGYKNFLTHVTDEKMFHPGVTENGFVRGLVHGWATVLYEGAHLAEEAFEIWQHGKVLDSDAAEEPPADEHANKKSS